MELALMVTSEVSRFISDYWFNYRKPNHYIESKKEDEVGDLTEILEEKNNLNESEDNKEEVIDSFIDEMREFLEESEENDGEHIDYFLKDLKKMIEIYVQVTKLDGRK